MKQFFILLLAFFIATAILPACSKEKNNPEEENTDPPTLAGTYNGTFIRTGMEAANFTIAFTGNNFTGSSTGSYPVICNGTFSMSGSQVSFNNACTDTGGIKLDGTYNYTLLRGATFKISRTSNNITDEYTLTLAR